MFSLMPFGFAVDYLKPMLLVSQTWFLECTAACDGWSWQLYGLLYQSVLLPYDGYALKV
jgi:hypothetical protein